MMDFSLKYSITNTGNVPGHLTRLSIRNKYSCRSGGGGLGVPRNDYLEPGETINYLDVPDGYPVNWHPVFDFCSPIWIQWVVVGESIYGQPDSNPYNNYNPIWVALFAV